MFRAPSKAGLPPFEMMLADVPANVRQVAQHLGLSVATVQRYARTGNAPRPVMLAMFWETKWGRDWADCEAVNFGRVHYARAWGLEREVAALRAQVLELEQVIQAGQLDPAANARFFRVGR